MLRVQIDSTSRHKLSVTLSVIKWNALAANSLIAFAEIFIFDLISINKRIIEACLVCLQKLFSDFFKVQIIKLIFNFASGEKGATGQLGPSGQKGEPGEARLGPMGPPGPKGEGGDQGII